MSVSIARKIAFDVLSRVESEDSYASDLLHHELDGGIKTEDAALATELTMGVLRRKRLLDFLLENYSRRRRSSIDAEVTIALRLGLYQLRFLDRVPARAAVHESVELVKRAGKGSAAGFANAVLRRAADDAQTPVASLIPGDFPQAEHLAILYSHPAWLIETWLAQFGEWRAIALLEANNRAPETAGALVRRDDQETDAELFAREGVKIIPGRWMTNAFRVASGNISNTKAFRDGRIMIQDEASQMVPRLLGVEPGDSVLDLCAAPGGKTVHLARAAGEGALVVAADIHAHRLGALKEQMERLHLNGVHVAEVDATHALPFQHKFKRILVDAPCSGAGTLARNPEIRWRLSPDDLTDFYARQTAILGSALGQLADGGRLVYSTCSFQVDENERVVAEALAKRRGFRRVPRVEVEAALAPHLVARADLKSLFDQTGVFRTFPPEHGTDGFFAVAIEKTA